jgi:type VI secretion system protein ImpM
MSCRPVTTWLFGKMPTHGDFVSRGLSPERRDRLDAWLSSEMMRTREQYGNAFDAAFDSAPPWQFANDEQGWEGGALCASIDLVGRRYPLIVGRSAKDDAGANIAADACETAIYRAFDDQLSADELWVVAADDLPGINRRNAVSGWWTDGNGGFPARHLPDAYPIGLIATMLEVGTNG